MECKFPSLVSLLIEINPVHNLILYFFKTHFVILPSIPSCPSFFLIQIRRQKKYPPNSSLCFDYRSGVLCWIQVMMLLLCYILQSPFTSSFWVHVLLSSLFCNTPIYILLLTLYRLKKVLIYPMFPDFRKSTACLECFQLLTFVLVVRATCFKA